MPRDPDVRWKQRLQSYRKALSQLKDAAETARARSLSKLEQQGLIQAFEFTHELAWKLMKDFLGAHGLTESLFGSKDATRAAFAAGLLDDGEVWMQMIGDRNQTSHTYNEETADEITARILANYMQCFKVLEANLGAKEKEEA